MTRFAKKMVFWILGYERAKALKRLVSGNKLEFNEADLILKLFRSENAGVMIDVGAHYGGSLFPYLLKGWSIYAFEPDPANRKKLETRIDINRIRLFDCAISDHENEGVPFFSSGESSGISGLSAFRETHEESAQVKLTTLSKILADEELKRVDFLKTDTEGHDFFALKGFPWKTFTPTAVLCEFEDSKSVPLGYTFRDMGDFLLEKGYRVFLSEWFPIRQYGDHHQWRCIKNYPCALEDEKGWGNFVAIRPEISFKPVFDYLSHFDPEQYSSLS